MTYPGRVSRFFSFFLILPIIFGVLRASPALAQQIIPAPPKLAAKAYILIDADTGKVLVEKNSTQSLPPASLTKMMTSYIVSEEIESGRLKEQDLVRVSDLAWEKGGSKSGSSTMFLNPRSEVPVIDLLRGVIIQSGNDASIALAEHIAGNEMAFADVMNQQAQLLGMTSTHFINATGWPAEGHLSTPYDLSLLAQALIRDHKEHYSIYSEKSFAHNGFDQKNRNTLLYRDKSVDGLKTGHTKEAGYCLVASAKKNDMRLISVVMGTDSKEARATASQSLLAYGFRYFSTHTLYKKADIIHTARVWGGLSKELALTLNNNVVATIPRGSHKKLQAQTQVDPQIKAPIVAGQELGRLVLTLDEEEIANVALVAANSVDEAGFFARNWDSFMLMIQGE